MIKNQDGIELVLVPANDHRRDGDETGDRDAARVSSFARLMPIVRLLARQAAAELYQAANDNAPFRDRARPRE